MASRTWEEIRRKNQPHSPTEEPIRAAEIFWPELCDKWGFSQGQYVFCRQPHGHKGMHLGLRDPQTRVGWA